MPSISCFYGITIYMYYLAKEHKPSHVHAYYGGYNAILSIETGELIEGNLPPNAIKLIKKWIVKNKEELQKMWDTQSFHRIEPLDE